MTLVRQHIHRDTVSRRLDEGVVVLSPLLCAADEFAVFLDTVIQLGKLCLAASGELLELL